MNDAKDFLDDATFNEMNHRRQTAVEDHQVGMLEALSVFYAGEYDCYLDNYKTIVTADSENYLVRFIYAQAMSRSYKLHFDAASLCLAEDLLDESLNHVVTALRRFPNDGPASELNKKIDAEIVVDCSCKEAEAIAAAGYVSESRLEFNKNLQIAENTIPGHSKIQKCFAAHGSAFDKPLLETITFILSKNMMNHTDVLQAAMLIARLRTIPALNQLNLIKQIEEQYKKCCQKVMTEIHKKGLRTLERLTQPNNGVHLAQAISSPCVAGVVPGVVMSLSESRGEKLTEDVGRMLDEELGLFSEKFTENPECDYKIGITVCDRYGDIAYTENRPQSKKSKYIARWETYANPRHAKLLTSIRRKQQRLPEARRLDQNLRDAAKSRSGNKWRKLLLDIGTSLTIANNEQDLLDEISDLEDELINTPRELKRAIKKNYTYKQQTKSTNLSCGFTLKIAMPNEQVMTQEFAYDNQYQDIEIYNVHEEDCEGVRVKVAERLDRDIHVGEMRSVMEKKLKHFIEGSFMELAKNAYKAEPNEGWSLLKKCDYIVTRIFFEQRKPMSNEQEELGSFFAERVLSACRGMANSKCFQVFEAAAIAESFSWNVTDSAWSDMGIGAGDQVVSCNGIDVFSENTFTMLAYSAQRKGVPLEVMVLRNDDVEVLTIDPSEMLLVPVFEWEQSGNSIGADVVMNVK